MPLDHECSPRVICPICHPDQRLMNALRRVWSAIGFDCLSALADENGNADMTNQQVVELVLDCDRLEHYGELPADVLAEFKERPYNEKVLIAQQAFPDQFYCF